MIQRVVLVDHKSKLNMKETTDFCKNHNELQTEETNKNIIK